jgi:hypothetical protein
MRKIKELEARIDRLERTRNCDNEVCANRNELNRKWLMDIETKQKEQEEFLKNTVAPFIANSLAKELDKGLTTVIDALFAEKPKKKENKKTDIKKTSKIKTKKESK